MKKSLLLGFIITILFLLNGCVTTRHDYQKVQARNDLIQENWMNHFNINPRMGYQNADRWFYTNYPDSFNQYAPNQVANVTAAEMRVTNFTRIKVEGPYSVQLYGAPCNRVDILGANNQVRHTDIQVRGAALYIRPARDCSNCGTLNNVVIRVGIRNLEYLYHAGTGLVVGRNIRSRCLVVKSSNSGNILLSGYMNVTNVVQGGRGTISLLGVYSPNVAVNVLGDGNVFLNGHVGINHIIKHGFGCLTIQGADTNNLSVNANNGLTTISGMVNLQSINTTGLARVYLYWVRSHGLCVNVHGNSRLGMAGYAENMNIAVDGNARYEGKCMHGGNIYINTAANAHANVTADARLYADAKDYSSIYFYSSPSIVSRFSSGQGLVIPIFDCGCTLIPPRFFHYVRAPQARRHRRCYKVYRKPVCRIHKNLTVYHGERPYASPKVTTKTVTKTKVVLHP